MWCRSAGRSGGRWGWGADADVRLSGSVTRIHSWWAIQTRRATGSSENAPRRGRDEVAATSLRARIRLDPIHRAFPFRRSCRVVYRMSVSLNPKVTANEGVHRPSSSRTGGRVGALDVVLLVESILVRPNPDPELNAQVVELVRHAGAQHQVRKIEVVFDRSCRPSEALPPAVSTRLSSASCDRYGSGCVTAAGTTVDAKRRGEPRLSCDAKSQLVRPA